METDSSLRDSRIGVLTPSSVHYCFFFPNGLLVKSLDLLYKSQAKHLFTPSAEQSG